MHGSTMQYLAQTPAPKSRSRKEVFAELDLAIVTRNSKKDALDNAKSDARNCENELCTAASKVEALRKELNIALDTPED